MKIRISSISEVKRHLGNGSMIATVAMVIIIDLMPGQSALLLLYFPLTVHDHHSLIDTLGVISVQMHLHQRWEFFLIVIKHAEVQLDANVPRQARNFLGPLSKVEGDIIKIKCS